MSAATYGTDVDRGGYQPGEEMRAWEQLRDAVHERLDAETVGVSVGEWRELGRRSRKYGMDERQLDDAAYAVACRVFEDRNTKIRGFDAGEVDEYGEEWVEAQLSDVEPVTYDELEAEIERYEPEEPLFERVEEKLSALL